MLGRNLSIFGGISLLLSSWAVYVSAATCPATPATATRLSTDGACGSNGAYCPAGTCCSQWGWCGSSSAYCDYSTGACKFQCTSGCTASSSTGSTGGTTNGNTASCATYPAGATTESPDGTCGPNTYFCPAGNCCSSYGWCGSTAAVNNIYIFYLQIF